MILPARNYRGSGSTASPVDENMYYQFEKRSWALITDIFQSLKMS